ncbi:MAG TPA: 6-carboxytetrahydropterin synthase [Terriglobales bacterium]
MVLMSRKAEFAASHYYYNPEWSEEENRRVFGKCANLQGHGHNYVIEVTVSGDVDPRTGFVMDLQDLKRVINECILEPFDHRHLNKEVPEFQTLVPTTENLAVVSWRRLAPHIKGTARLFRVRMYETADIFADYYGADEPSADDAGDDAKAHSEFNRRYRFSASHRLHNPALSEEENKRAYGKCNNPHGHGHNYVVEVTVSGAVDPETGMVCNLADLDGFMHRELIDGFDESNLNEHPLFRGAIPTTEAVCQKIFEHVDDGFKHAKLERVRVEETGQNAFECFGPAD